MTMIFPAIFIGGPPHSGKSTLFYRLSQTLRRLGVAHYGLRASPDGEGDWSYEVGEPLVRELRMRSKEDWTPQFSSQICCDIDTRHLPLLVDVGGKITLQTIPIMAACTHGLLIAAHDGDLEPWHAQLAKLGRPLLAELRSELTGEQDMHIHAGVLRGSISGLRQGESSDGPCFTALVRQIQQLFSYSPSQLFQIHRSLLQIELVIDLEQAISPLPAHVGEQRWEPAELPTLLAALPAEEPMAIYGRGPLWLMAALAAITYPTPQLFNPRHGWTPPPTLRLAEVPDTARLDWDCVVRSDHTRVSMRIPHGYLALEDSQNLPVPVVDLQRGVVLDGKLPGWLLAGLARIYRNALWVAVYQPQLSNNVVIYSRVDDVHVGDVHSIGEPLH
ncbi:MAG: hypothetical protein HGA19_03450 [Oscillochloris sp.]|nr:hypothetical protein [Oscillochloris sp.]